MADSFIASQNVLFFRKDVTFTIQKIKITKNMKKLLLLFISFIVVTAQAQTADEVIQKYASYLGGMDAFNKLSSIKMTGTVTVQGMDLPITIQIVNGKAMRTDVEVMGQSVVNVYNNGTGWKINPFAGVPDATDVTGDELAEFKSQSSIASTLMEYQSRGDKAESDGEEVVNGVKTYKIKVTGKDDGKVTTYFINSTDYSLVKSISNREIMGQDATIETFYSDYKDFDGLKFSMSRKQEMDGQEFQSIAFSNIELNIPIDEKIFAK
jgi:hypothetical protein